MQVEPNIAAIEAPLNANVWKVQANEGDVLNAEQTLVVLEAMKLEINVLAEQNFEGARIEKLLVKPGDVVDSGQALMLIRREGRVSSR